eukprot:m.256740 g.256740  ORF g.256740 m.256740 type:complete len:577 (+) comp34661_c0_seq1:148-1878(+)
MFKLLALIAIQAAICVGHVRLINDGDVTWAIRNARAATADGAFSVAGPCGGANTFGANGMTTIIKGTEMTVKINYNGGHKSAANEFHAVYKCTTTGPTQTEMKAIVDDTTATTGLNDLMTLTLKDGTAPTPKTDKPNYIDASTGNSVTAGYSLVFDLPTEAIGMCTISIVDQRDWGGCVDLMVTEPTAPTPPPVPTPPPTPFLLMEELVGRYRTSPQYDSCLSNFPTCCCVEAKVDVYKNSAGVRTSINYNINSNYTYNMSKLCTIQNASRDASIFVKQGQQGQFFTTTQVGEDAQPMMFDMRRNVISITNQAEETPLYCDSIAYLVTPTIDMVDKARANYTTELAKGEDLKAVAMENPTTSNIMALKNQLIVVNASYATLQTTIMELPATDSVAKVFGGNMTLMNMTHSNFTISASVVASTTATDASGSGSSSSSIAGIVIGVLLLLVVAALLIVFRNTIAEKLGLGQGAPVKKTISIEDGDIEDGDAALVPTSTNTKRGPPPRVPPPPRLQENATYNPVEPNSGSYNPVIPTADRSAANGSYNPVAPNPAPARRPPPPSRPVARMPPPQRPHEL